MQRYFVSTKAVSLKILMKISIERKRQEYYDIMIKGGYKTNDFCKNMLKY